MKPTPDLDPEEVRRALDTWGEPSFPESALIVAASRAWLASLPPDTTTPSPYVTGSCGCDGSIDPGCPVCTASMRQPAPDVRAQIAELRQALDAANRLLGDDADLKDRLVKESRDVQAQIDAAVARERDDARDTAYEVLLSVGLSPSDAFSVAEKIKRASCARSSG